MPNGRGGWLCRCECGNAGKHLAHTLETGHSKSCGCLKSEMHTTHGLWKTRSYKVWAGMMQRCYREYHASWPYYGGRGITVCDRWHDVRAFVEDMGECPKGLSIERIDVNGNYCPENCKWATNDEQRANTRMTRHVIYKGRRVHFREAARLSGIPDDTLRRRLKLGWSWEKATSEPLRYSVRNPQMLHVDGKVVKLVDAAKQCGLTPAQVRFRIASGWSDKDAVTKPLKKQKRSAK